MILRRYIYREISYRLVGMTVLLMFLFGTNKLLAFLSDAATGRIPASFVMQLFSLRMISMLTEGLPFILFLAIILTFARMNHDNELPVMAASGVGKKSQLGIVLRYVLYFSVFVFLFAFFIGPWAELKLAEGKRMAWQEANFSVLSAGKFKEFDRGRNVVYVESLSEDKTHMQDVFLQIKEEEGSSILKSRTARFEIDAVTGNRFIRFFNGIRYLGQPGELDFRVTEFREYSALIDAPDEIGDINDPDTFSIMRLLHSHDNEAQAELQWRISAIIISILLSILAVLLNQYPFGQKPFTLLIFGILIYFTYSNLLGISKSLMEAGSLTPLLGLWWVHGFLILVIFIIYNYTDISQRLKQKKEVQYLPANK